MRNKIRQTYTLDRDLVSKIDKKKGRKNKSAYVNELLGNVFDKDEIESKAV